MAQAAVVDALVTLLGNVAGIDRVWGVELPGAEIESGNMPRENAVVMPVGGTGGEGARSYLPVSTYLYEVRCYGATPYTARVLSDLAYDALKALEPQVVSGVYLRSVTVSAGPYALRDPDVDWPFDLRTYEVTADERVVA